MRTTGKLIIFILTFLAMAVSAYAQTPREQLQQMAEQLQKAPNDNALREKIITLAASIKPAPAIPEEAREPFVMGATVLKKSSDPAGASKAVDLFTQALNIAPWFADAYYNRAIAREAAGQYELAIDDIKFYLEFKLTDAERREAQDKIYSLKAEAQLGSANKAEDKQAAIRTQEQRISGPWKRPHTLNDGVPRLIILYVRETSSGIWNMFYDFYINNAQVAHDRPFLHVNQDANVLANGELRFADGCYNVRGTVSADGNTLNLAYTIRSQGECSDNAKEEILKYTK